MKINLKDFVKSELNPGHDLSRHMNEFCLKDYAMVAANVYKSMIRGSAAGAGVGSAAGAIIALISGEDITQDTLEGMIIGGSLGFALDELQYLTMYSIHRVKHSVVYPMLDLYRGIKSN